MTRHPITVSQAPLGVVVCGLLCVSGLTSAQSIRTFAGGGADDGVPASFVAVRPNGITFDRQGNVYFVDEEFSRIRKVEARTGLVSTFAGVGSQVSSEDGLPATVTSLSAPRGIVIEGDSLFVAETTADKIRRIDMKTGLVSTLAGTGRDLYYGCQPPFDGPALSICLRNPIAIAEDLAGNLLWTESSGGLRRLDKGTGEVTTLLRIESFGSCSPNSLAWPCVGRPWGVAVDRSGSIFVSDEKNGTVLKGSADGKAWQLYAGTYFLGPLGDGKPATQAMISPQGICVDPAGNLYIADRGTQRVRKIEAATGLISTVAGSAEGRTSGGLTWTYAPGFSGDGGPATLAKLSYPNYVSIGPSGDVYVSDIGNLRVRRIDPITGTITTFAGTGGAYSGDGGPATAARLFYPGTVAGDVRGNVIFMDDSAVRIVDAETGILSTLGSIGTQRAGNDGSMVTDTDGNLIFAGGSRLWRLSRKDASVQAIAGSSTAGYSGDGGPATMALLKEPGDVCSDPDGNIYFIDSGNKRIRKINRASQAITTIAGNGAAAFGGDGGPATQASLQDPRAVAADSRGNIFVLDTARVRRIDMGSGVISTVAGDEPSSDDSGDGGPGTAARLSYPFTLAIGPSDDLLIATARRLRMLSAATGLINSIAGALEAPPGGTSLGSFPIGEGPARSMDVIARSLWVNANGDIFFPSDYSRISAIRACRSQLGGFALALPDDAATVAPGPLRFSWGGSAAAFSYDLILDTSFPPRKAVISGTDSTSVLLPSLEPGRTYFWQVRARGDPYCAPAARTSEIRRFSVSSSCGPPEAPVLHPASVAGMNVTVTFDKAEGAGSYDIYLGTENPSVPIAAGLTATSLVIPGLAPGKSYRWRVVAHAACDVTLTSSSAESAFTTPGTCPVPVPPELGEPADGASGLSENLRLSWKPSSPSWVHDLYLTTGQEQERLLSAGIEQSSLEVSLDKGKAYRWRVVARNGCDASEASSDSRSFSTSSGCPEPDMPRGLAVSGSTLLQGSPYVVSWEPSISLGVTGFYRLERSQDAGFKTGIEIIETRGNSAVLFATSPGDLHHRVVAVASCGSRSIPSDARRVAVSTGPPFLVMAIRPSAIVTPQPPSGVPIRRLEVDALNTGGSNFSGFFSTSQPTPFFTLSSTVLALRPGEQAFFYLDFKGFPTNRRTQSQGVVSVVPFDASGGASYPQAAVSLSVTDSQGVALPSTDPPVILVSGRPAEAVRFEKAPLGTVPADLFIELRNPGSVPLDLAAEVSPAPWVSVVPGWNSTPIPPGSTRLVKLTCDRFLGGSAGSFPRTASLTFRTIDGKSSRILVEDPGPLFARPCPGRSLPSKASRSWIVPAVVNAVSKSGARYISRLLLTNMGPDPLLADIYYTPDTGSEAASGYDLAKVLQASLMVPGHDVLSFSDVVGSLFAVEGSGSLEIRSARAEQLRIQSVVETAAPAGGSFGFLIPIVRGGDGARPGRPQVAAGVREDSTFRTNLILTETMGQAAEITLSLLDQSGSVIGRTMRSCPPFSKQQVALSELSNGVPVPAGAVEIQAEPASAGAVTGVLTVIDNRTADASSIILRPPSAGSAVFTLASAVVSTTFKSRLEVRNNGNKPVTYTLEYRGGSGTIRSQPRRLTARQLDVFDNVLSDVFAIQQPSYGPLVVSADSSELSVISRVYTESPSGSFGDSIEAVTLDERISAGEGNRVLVTDGLEGTAEGDRSRGARTNLILTEIAGQPAELEIAIWEKSQRRSAPTGRLTVALAPFEQRQLNDLFGEDGFRVGWRDWLDVLCTISSKSSSRGSVIGLATRIDNKTQDTKNLVLRP